jgi:hypothetical protein
VRLQPDRDHGLDRTAERSRIHVGVITADHAPAPQRPHPSETVSPVVYGFVRCEVCAARDPQPADGKVGEINELRTGQSVIRQLRVRPEDRRVWA